MNKKQIIIIVVSLILLVAIPLSLYLVRSRQTVRSRAAEGGARVEFVDDQGNVITETRNRDVKIRIMVIPSASPLSSPLPSSSASPST